MERKIFCIGGANIDYKLKLSEPIILSSSNPVCTTFSFGGVARNVAENLVYLTGDAHLQCVVGQDKEGEALLNHLKKQKVDVNHSLIIEGAQTANYYAVLGPQGELFASFSAMDIYSHPNLSKLVLQWDWPFNSINFLDTNLPSIILKLALEQAKEKNCLVCIDPVSVTKAKKLLPLLEGIFLIKPDLFEAELLSGVQIKSINDAILAGQILLSAGTENVVISMGKEGQVLINKHYAQHILPIHPDQILDVSGAGDAFFATLLAGLQKNLSLLTACQLGNIAAMHTIQSAQTVVPNLTLTDLIYLSKQYKALYVE